MIPWNKATEDVVKGIVDLMRISPEHGNAVMDLVGLDNYLNILRLNEELE